MRVAILVFSTAPRTPEPAVRSPMAVPISAGRWRTKPPTQPSEPRAASAGEAGKDFDS